MIEPSVFICAPLDFNGICKIYPPTVYDVVTNPNFTLYQKILTMTQEELDYEYKKNGGEGQALTPLEFLLSSSYHSLDFRNFAYQAFNQFTREKIIFLYEQKLIVFCDETIENNNNNKIELKDLRYLDEERYSIFQNQVRKAIGLKAIKPPEPIDPNEDPRIRRIKEKARERDRIKAKQQGKNGIQFSTCLAAICCMGIGITPLNIGELSYASIGTLMNMMQEKEKYDIDIRSLLAGADSKKIKPKYWIRNDDKE